jgi:hypothetical protein
MQRTRSGTLVAMLAGAALLPIGSAASARPSLLALDRAAVVQSTGPSPYRLAQHVATPDAAQPPGPSVNETGAATAPPPPPDGAPVPPPPDQKLMPPPSDKTPTPASSSTAGQAPAR